MEEKPNQFCIRTKRPGQYFCGYLFKSYDTWAVLCTSFSGGGSTSLLIGTTIYWSDTNKKRLFDRLKRLAKNRKLIFTRDKRKF